jgi:hypothetical protein
MLVWENGETRVVYCFDAAVKFYAAESGAKIAKISQPQLPKLLMPEANAS